MTSFIPFHFSLIEKNPDLEKMKNEYIPTQEEKDNEYNPFDIYNYQTFNPLFFDYILSLKEESQNLPICFYVPFQFVDMYSVYDIKRKKIENKNIFIKNSPLIDPIRYMIGKYEKKKTLNIPSFETMKTMTETEILNTKNNASIVDSYFCFLSSKMLNNYGFIHGVDFYGSFFGIQTKYKFNIHDDLEYIKESKFFHKNIGKLFSLSREYDNDTSLIEGLDTEMLGEEFNSKIKRKLKSIYSDDGLVLEDVENVIIEDSVSDTEENICESNVVIEENIYERDESLILHSVDDNDDDSVSQTDTEDGEENSISVNSEDDQEDDTEDDDASADYQTETDESSETTLPENEIHAYINNFPVQLICLEKYDGTLDSLFEKEEITQDVGRSVMFQVVVSLLVYQKVFKMTHNDLHTNNIMYKNTNAEFIYYAINKKQYKVPTYGKIYKIIDFGRSIYTYNNTLHCSDSFEFEGDANTQYNFPPYMNPKKEIIEPNYSFDLCRLGCSIYDFIIEDDTVKQQDKFDEFQKFIYKLCLDDKGKNILYKRDGDDRYPNFKLYKMIARKVHHCTPEIELDNSFFLKFATSKGKLKKTDIYCDIDMIIQMPCLF